MEEIKRILKEKLFVEYSDTVGGIDEAAKEIEGMNCGNCKKLNPFDAEKHDPMCKHHRMRISEFSLNIFKCNSWEATK